jgi:hypothetical protein
MRLRQSSHSRESIANLIPGDSLLQHFWETTEEVIQFIIQAQCGIHHRALCRTSSIICIRISVRIFLIKIPSYLDDGITSIQ